MKIEKVNLFTGLILGRAFHFREGAHDFIVFIFLSHKFKEYIKMIF